MADNHSPLTGLKRVLNSAKVQAAASGTAAAYIAVRYATPTLPPDQRAYLWVAFLAGAFWMIRELVNAWAKEDAAEKSAPAPPPVQVNTGTQAANVQQTAPTAPAPVTMAQVVQAINTLGKRLERLETPPEKETES